MNIRKVQETHSKWDFTTLNDTICSMFEKRLKELKQQLKKEKLDGVLVSSVSNIEYLTGFTNFSKDEREAYIFLGGNFGYIITDGRYSEAVKNQILHLKLFERGNNRSIEDLFKKHKINSLGIEEDNLTVTEYKKIKKYFKNIKHFEVSKLRAVKEKEEIEKIEKACSLGDEAFKYILTKIKVGVTEKETAFELERFVKENKADFSFGAIVAFGKNSSVPHHQTESTKLKDGDFVLLDFGVKFENYCSDMTRTVFFGKPTEKQKEIYRTVYEAQQKAFEFLDNKIKSGKKVTGGEVDKVARDYIVKKGYPSIPHSLGHGIGIEVHENPYLSPKSKDKLKKGMVFSIEPGIYIPDFGGVRIEDLYLIEDRRLRQLTTSSKDLIKL